MKFSKDKKFVGKMFDEISPTYDRLNHLLSGYQDNRWRKQAVKFLSNSGNKYDIILDLACGSGDLGLEFQKLNPKKIYSADLSIEMLKIDMKKLDKSINLPIRAEAEHLPFSNSTFDLCGIGFGVRNFQNLDNCLKEICRVLRSGASFVTIEMFKPLNSTIAGRIFKQYFEKVLPKIGNKMAGSQYAYSYLFDSVDNFLPVREYTEKLLQNGFKVNGEKNNFLGIVHTVFAEKL
ncbi:MAG: ubiquinone/menaquinone biosynthesis methyltransferase [Ignavibacteria bacterium]|nr:ubiquinone/menaquinone biosynthesis methyltransferase [Ignavibacteria bacterium]